MDTKELLEGLPKFKHEEEDKCTAIGLTTELYKSCIEYIVGEIENVSKLSVAIENLENRIKEKPLFLRAIIAFVTDLVCSLHVDFNEEVIKPVVDMARDMLKKEKGPDFIRRATQFLKNHEDELQERVKSGEDHNNVMSDLARRFMESEKPRSK